MFLIQLFAYSEHKTGYALDRRFRVLPGMATSSCLVLRSLYLSHVLNFILYLSQHIVRSCLLSHSSKPGLLIGIVSYLHECSHVTTRLVQHFFFPVYYFCFIKFFWIFSCLPIHYYNIFLEFHFPLFITILNVYLYLAFSWLSGIILCITIYQ